MKKAQKNGYNYEKKMAEKRGIHIGGPGQPDYRRGKILGEVKATKKPVGKDILKKLLNKGITEVESRSGFTKPGQKFAKKEKIALREKGKSIN